MTNEQVTEYIKEYKDVHPVQLDAIYARLETADSSPAEELEYLDLYIPTNINNS